MQVGEEVWGREPVGPHPTALLLKMWFLDQELQHPVELVRKQILRLHPAALGRSLQCTETSSWC